MKWTSLFPHQRATLTSLYSTGVVRLRHHETLYYYDGPVMATMRDEAGRYYLAVAVDSDKRTTDDNEIVVYAALEISQRRLKHICNNNMTLREAFRFPERGTYGTTVYFDTSFRIDDSKGPNAETYLAIPHPMEPEHFPENGCRLVLRHPEWRWRRGRRQRVNLVGRRCRSRK